MQAQQVRDTRLDAIRSLALLMIITVHTWSLGRVTTFPLIAACYHAFSDCGVPLFVMVSGALILSQPITNLSKFYSRRFLRILVPFFIWSLVVYVLSAVMGKYDDVHSVWDALLAYFPRLMENRINEAYWFVQMISVLYVLTPMLRWTIEHLTMRQLAILGLLWLGAIALCDSFPDCYMVREYTSRTLLYTGYYLLGYLLYSFTFRLPSVYKAGTEKMRNFRILLSLLILSVAALWILCYPTQILCLRVILVTALFALLCLCPQAESNLLRFVSDSSYTVYLMHMLTIAPLYMLLGYGSHASAWQCAIIPIATTCMVAAICLCFCYLLRRLTGKKAWWMGVR